MVWSMMYTSGPFFFPVKRPRRLIAQIAALVLASSSWVLAQKPGDSTPAANPAANPGTTSLTRPAEGKSKAHADESFQTLVQLNDALEGLAARVSPAVVQILVTGYGPLREEDRAQTALIVRQHAVGSGVIVDANGYVMTNAHVVEGAQRIRVALPLPMSDSGQVPEGKRRILEARLLGLHKETDLALLKIDDTDLPTLSLVSQQRPRVGQLVFAIGSPEGLQNSVTMGVISALARQPCWRRRRWSRS
jgi:serine protease Do